MTITVSSSPKPLTAANCRKCHEPVYQQFARSRHAAPSWAAVYGEQGKRAGHPLDGPNKWPSSEKFPPRKLQAARPIRSFLWKELAAVVGGCAACHSIGRPNADGSIGTAAPPATRGIPSSVGIVRLPSTAAASATWGPTTATAARSIYTESKHGVMFEAQRNLLNLAVEPAKLTTHDMFVPTCATCHMSGLNGMKVTHDPSEEAVVYRTLPAEVSDKRPQYDRAQAEMKGLCLNCHTQPLVDRIYREAEAVVAGTNEKIQEAQSIVTGLRQEGVLTSKPFQQPIDFLYFDIWHYYGRTSKHGAFMGGGDFVQWHGNYPILKHTVELKALAEELRREHGKK